MAGTVADAAVCLCAPQLSVWSPVSNGLAGSVFNLLFCVLVVRARGNVSKSLYYEGAEMKSKDEILMLFLAKRAATSTTLMIKVVRLNGALLEKLPVHTVIRGYS